MQAGHGLPEGGRQVPHWGDYDPVQLQPLCHELQFFGEFDGGVGGRAGLGVAGPGEEAAGCAVRFQVDAGHDPVAEQEGQHVVAVAAFGFRGVDLDPVVEAEEFFQQAALKDREI